MRRDITLGIQNPDIETDEKLFKTFIRTIIIRVASISLIQKQRYSNVIYS